jgi:integrase
VTAAIRCRARLSAEIHPLDPDQIPQLADAIRPRFRCAIFTASHTGLRAGKLWALKVSRTNILKRTIHVVESVSETRRGLVTNPPKSGKPRTVTLPRAIAQMMAQQLHDYPSADGFVFTAPRADKCGTGTSWTTTSFRPWTASTACRSDSDATISATRTPAISSLADGVQSKSRTV